MSNGRYTSSCATLSSEARACVVCGELLPSCPVIFPAPSGLTVSLTGAKRLPVEIGTSREIATFYVNVFRCAVELHTFAELARPAEVLFTRICRETGSRTDPQGRSNQ